MTISLNICRCILMAFLVLLSVGCEKKAAFEAQVTDIKGRPIPQVKVSALQDSPVQGYGQFETITNIEGRFSFKKLFPLSEYTLVIDSEQTGVRQIKIKTPSDGQTGSLPVPITFRFMMSEERSVIDTKSGLQWAPDPNIGMTWHEAKKHVRDLKIGGHTDWRMPKRSELLTLDIIDTSVPLNDCCVWTAEQKDGRKAWYFNVYRRFDDSALMTNNSYRVLAVRTALLD